jgi:predicted molibdopterin-dependent oxidoreductase YjgC
MFRRRPDSRASTVTVTVEGRPVLAPEGASAAAAVLLAGLDSIRETPVGGVPRAPYCLMGVCFDCLAEIDGVPNRQSCMVTVAPGMAIRRQIGKRNAGVPPASK